MKKDASPTGWCKGTERPNRKIHRRTREHACGVRRAVTLTGGPVPVALSQLFHVLICDCGLLFLDDDIRPKTEKRNRSVMTTSTTAR